MDENSKKQIPNYYQWIRENVPEYKLEYAKRFLSDYGNYFDFHKPQMIEHCYRACKNSIKIRYALEDTIEFTRMLVYLLTPDKKLDSESDVEKDLIQLVGTESFVYNYFQQVKTGTIEKKGNYYLFDKVALTWLGGNILFFYILVSVVYMIEKIHTEKDFKFDEIDWREPIANYVIAEFVDR